jgi:hypothetical protein
VPNLQMQAALSFPLTSPLSILHKRYITHHNVSRKS